MKEENCLKKRNGKFKEENIKKNWSKLKVIKVESNGANGKIMIGQEYPIKAEIDLGNLTPDDVEVQVYYGPSENTDDPHLNSSVVMETSSTKSKPGIHTFEGKILCKISGEQGYTIRIMPKNQMLISPFDLGLVYWAGE